MITNNYRNGTLLPEGLKSLRAIPVSTSTSHRSRSSQLSPIRGGFSSKVTLPRISGVAASIAATPLCTCACELRHDSTVAQFARSGGCSTSCLNLCLTYQDGEKHASESARVQL